MTSPSDGGPCPECGKSMDMTVYEVQTTVYGTIKVSGRYWHMKNEHGIFEHYDLRRNDA